MLNTCRHCSVVERQVVLVEISEPVHNVSAHDHDRLSPPDIVLIPPDRYRASVFYTTVVVTVGISRSDVFVIAK